MTYPVQPNADPNDLLNGEREIGIAWHEFPADHLNRYQFTRSLLTRQATVLDVGCGVGYGSHLLAKVAKQVIGLDYRPHVIDYAQKHWGGANQSFVCGDALQEFSYPSLQFDVITAFEIIEHLPDDHKFLKLLRKHLKPNGVLLISAPNLQVMSHPEDNPWHYRHYTPEQFRSLLQEVFPRIAQFTQIQNDVIPGCGGRTNVLVAYTKWPRVFTMSFVSQEYPSTEQDANRYPISGGIGTYTQIMARGLARFGHCVHVISRTNSGDYPHELKDESVVVHRIPDVPLRPTRIQWRWGQAGQLIARARSVQNFLAGSSAPNFDLIEAAEWKAETLLCRRKSTSPVFVTRLHTPSFVSRMTPAHHLGWRERFVDWCEKINVQLADAITAPSRAIAALCHHEWRISPIAILPNPIGSAATHTDTTTSHEVRIGYFPGRFDQYKGFDVLADALLQCLSSLPDRCRFVLVGSDHLDSVGRIALKQLAPWIDDGTERLPITVLPRQPYSQCHALAATTNVTLLTSAYENFPYVILEAMAAGRLVIAPNVGGIPEMVQDGVTGLLYEPNSVSQLADTLLQVISNPQLLSKLGNAAQCVVQNQFGANVWLPTFEVYYTYLIGQKRLGYSRKRPFAWWLPNRGPLTKLLAVPFRS